MSTLIQVAPETLNSYSSKWPEVKIFSTYISSSQNVLEFYLVEGFYIRKCYFRQFFNKKVRASTPVWWCFCVFQTVWAYMIPR
jgi:hypothetical protein